MVAMTPIAEIWIMGRSVFALDFAGKTNPMADCVDEATAVTVGKGLSQHHGRPLFVFSVDHRKLVPYRIGRVE